LSYLKTIGEIGLHTRHQYTGKNFDVIIINFSAQTKRKNEDTKANCYGIINN